MTTRARTVRLSDFVGDARPPLTTDGRTERNRSNVCLAPSPSPTVSPASDAQSHRQKRRISDRSRLLRVKDVLIVLQIGHWSHVCRGTFSELSVSGKVQHIPLAAPRGATTVLGASQSARLSLISEVVSAKTIKHDRTDGVRYCPICHDVPRLHNESRCTNLVRQ
jgi:hypothetical protein